MLRLGNIRGRKQEIDGVVLACRNINDCRSTRRIVHAKIHLFRLIVLNHQHVRALPALGQASRAFDGHGYGAGAGFPRRRCRQQVAEGLEQRFPPTFSAAVFIVAHLDHALIGHRRWRLLRRRRPTERIRGTGKCGERADGKDDEAARTGIFHHGFGFCNNDRRG